LSGNESAAGLGDEGDTLAAVAVLAAGTPQAEACDPVGAEELAVGDDSISDLYPVDQLRRLLSWIASPDAERDNSFTLRRIAGILPHPRWVEAFVDLSQLRRNALDPYLKRLTQAKDFARQLASTNVRQQQLLALARETAEVDSHTLLRETQLTFVRTT